MRRQFRILLLLTTTVASGVAAQPLTVADEERIDEAERKGALLALGTGAVRYDPGAPADALLTGGGPGLYTDYFGNVFDTRNGAPLSPGTITRVSWYAGNAGTYAASTQIVAFGPPSGSISTYGLISGVAPLAFNSVTAALPFSGSIFGAILARTYGQGGVFGSVGARSASTGSQGFHGVLKSFYAGNTSVLPGQNVMIRVSGTLVVPVELMEFELQ